MTPEETAIKLNELAKLMVENTPDMTQTAALTAKALIQERIQELGEDANEVALTPYSDEYINVRNKKGYETAFTNLTFTGQMWRATGIVSEGATAKGYTVQIGGGDTTSKNKVQWNSERYGDILRVSKKEETQLQVQINEQLNDFIKQVGL